jgi:hypothetical protein
MKFFWIHDFLSSYLARRVEHMRPEVKHDDSGVVPRRNALCHADKLAQGTGDVFAGDLGRSWAGGGSQVSHPGTELTQFAAPLDALAEGVELERITGRGESKGEADGHPDRDGDGQFAVNYGVFTEKNDFARALNGKGLHLDKTKQTKVSNSNC